MKRKPGITKVELTVASIAFALVLSWSAGFIDTAHPFASLGYVVFTSALSILVFALVTKGYNHFFRYREK
ncbi:hypothetical protein M0E87_00720 [Corynebacterium sp. CCM 9185]|uniref:Uncharacterized protein n=1 Tax=Corynebacterium marambiense TaxID=2765364 RepID=A0ABS0VZG5_9CORY|nr:hypothetical protein [Corynebacterium marambiense]MBI9001729.1 hypothetical protein [Corynebacterium marambiense]MCK7662193.1 hypothetical protein [Corynebacterium marambiense]MCX7541463.1 hypothetical protein [Corynebacterium marambiense]